MRSTINRCKKDPEYQNSPVVIWEKHLSLLSQVIVFETQNVASAFSDHSRNSGDIKPNLLITSRKEEFFQESNTLKHFNQHSEQIPLEVPTTLDSQEIKFDDDFEFQTFSIIGGLESRDDFVSSLAKTCKYYHNVNIQKSETGLNFQF